MFIVDSHCDSIQKVDVEGSTLINEYNFSKKNCQLQFVAMMAERSTDKGNDSYHRTLRYTNKYQSAISNESANILPVKCYKDVEIAFKLKKHASILCIESATGLNNSPKLLEEFYNYGVRVVGLTWLSNKLAKSNRVFDDGEEDTGISDIGKEFVKKGNELGIIWDVSHLSDKSFWDLTELSKKPIIATHSNFRALCNHSRNLTDDMANFIIKNGGMIGLNLATKFIHEDDEKQTVNNLFKHLDYCLELGGENSIGLGLDIDGITKYPKPLTLDTSIHDQIINLLLKNYSEKLTEKVVGLNYLNYLKKWL